jgi:hypothetical protein
MQRAKKNVLYYTDSASNSPTMTVKPSEWFEVETQMNHSSDAELVPDDIRELYNQHRSDSLPQIAATRRLAQ